MEAPDHPTPLEKLLQSQPGKWEAIRGARERSRTKLGELEQEFTQRRRELRPDATLVVFGSLARLEATPGSDLDWAILIDGQADGADFDTSLRISRRLCEMGEKAPGITGIFGRLVFSHPLIHDIGGSDDTNINTTRRVLMLLESRAIGDSEVRDRVLRSIIRRYVEQQTHYKEDAHVKRPYLPRFLLNDVIRYWRILAVDYANKVRQGGAKGWALRNIKLRMSRKLLYTAGLFLCLETHLGVSALARPDGWLFPEYSFPEEPDLAPYVDLLFRRTALTPLDHLARACERFATSATTDSIFSSYDRFLEFVSNTELRKSLDGLSYEDSKRHTGFNDLREVSHEFQRGLTRLFFDENPQLADIMQTYAVF